MFIYEGDNRQEMCSKASVASYLGVSFVEAFRLMDLHAQHTPDSSTRWVNMVPVAFVDSIPTCEKCKGRQHEAA